MTDALPWGGLACLASAGCWAVAVAMFRKPIADYGAPAVNLVKCSIAAVLVGLTAVVAGEGTALAAAPLWAIGLISASAIIGMTVGDTALFAAVTRIGVHNTLLLQTLGPVFTAILAFSFAGERLHAIEIAGAAVILLGVGLVIWQQRRDRLERHGGHARMALIGGVFFAVLAAFGQGAGVVLAKSGLEEIPLLSATFLRLLVAALSLVVLLGLTGQSSVFRDVLFSRRALRRLLAPSLVGTYFAMIMMMAGVALSDPTVAAVLLGTTPVFSLFIDARVRGVPVTRSGLLGTLVAVGGVVLVSAPF